jgi:hypothetical protein
VRSVFIELKELRRLARPQTLIPVLALVQRSWFCGEVEPSKAREASLLMTGEIEGSLAHRPFVRKYVTLRQDGLDETRSVEDVHWCEARLAQVLCGHEVISVVQGQFVEKKVLGALPALAKQICEGRMLKVLESSRDYPNVGNRSGDSTGKVTGKPQCLRRLHLCQPSPHLYDLWNFHNGPREILRELQPLLVRMEVDAYGASNIEDAVGA